MPESPRSRPAPSPAARPAPEELTSEQVARIAARAADSKHGRDIVALEVRELTSIADYFVLVSVTSSTQAEAVCDAVDQALSREGREPLHVEGRTELTWVLMDYADVIVHVFREDARSFYGLERLWGDAPRLDLGLEHPAPG
jgi:ribosome-associated protein